MYNSLTTQRVLSIDAFRGITILVMIFVNELAGVQDIPAWMKHMPADADAMTFVDVVFPAFLFIVGMSVPFAINNRLAKGDSFWKLQGHILFRAAGLLVLGVFMVNAEGSEQEGAMIMPVALWSLLFYACVILVWNVYTFENKTIAYVLRGAGVAGLIFLAVIFRGGEDGTESLRTHWWGILGLIGWAYLAGCILYQLVKGNIGGLLVFIVLCIAVYAAGKSPAIRESASWHWISGFGGHATHTALVLSGIVLSLIFFDQKHTKTISRRFTVALVFALMLFVAGYFLRPYYTISKIYATPTWTLYSAVICCVLFSFLYWLTDLKKINGWTGFIRPAGSNPLLTYIIPFIVYALMRLLHLSWPDILYQGAYGIIWSMVYALLVMASVIGLNRLKIKLQL